MADPQSTISITFTLAELLSMFFGGSGTSLILGILGYKYYIYRKNGNPNTYPTLPCPLNGRLTSIDGMKENIRDMNRLMGDLIDHIKSFTIGVNKDHEQIKTIQQNQTEILQRQIEVLAQIKQRS